MSVLVVGSRGYVGTRLCIYLRNRGCEVHEIDKDSDCINSQSGLLNDAYMLPSGCDCIFYLAQSPYYRKDNERPTHLITVSVLNAIRLAELASHNIGTRYIYASTGNVYASSFVPLVETAPLRKDDWYSLSKLHAEEALALLLTKLDLTIVRLFGIYGPGQTDKLVPGIFERLSKKQEIMIDRNPLVPEDLDGLKISLCYIDDVVKILADLIDVKGAKILNLAGREVASIRQITTMAAQELGIIPVFRLTDKHRDFDLIADTTHLQKTLNPALTPLSVGISATVKSYAQQCDNGRLL